ncbi:MAG TPA: hypothetical protein VF733_04370 [Candidatus Saccharimonadales bacterium]
MNKLWKAVFIIILVTSAYHLIRDLLQTFDMDSAFTNIAHRPHEWCGQYCDVVTIPFDVITIAVSAYILKRNKVGKMGIALLATLPLWLIFSLLP